MTDHKRKPPPEPRPDPIVIRVRKGKARAVYEIPGKHFDAELTSPLGKGLTVGHFHDMTVTLPELPQ